uniref:hypothetical protein n=1 Tax=Actinobacillus porcinus TaxID=51048 RepID=UPI002355746D
RNYGLKLNKNFFVEHSCYNINCDKKCGEFRRTLGYVGELNDFNAIFDPNLGVTVIVGINIVGYCTKK